MLTFRTSITFAVMAFVVALTALLIAVQVRSFHWATREAASAYMDATSTKALGRLQTEITAIASLVNVLATSSGVADSKRENRDRPRDPAIQSRTTGIAPNGQYLRRFRKWRRVQIVRLWRDSRYPFRPILVSGGAWVALLRIPKSRSWRTRFGGGEAAFAVLEHYYGLTQALRTADATLASR
jgi:hypothetical protein